MIRGYELAVRHRDKAGHPATDVLKFEAATMTLHTSESHELIYSIRCAHAKRGALRIEIYDTYGQLMDAQELPFETARPVPSGIDLVD